MSGELIRVTDVKCACPHPDRHECWRIRYPDRDYDITNHAMDYDGGPCECGCHEIDDDLYQFDTWNQE